VRSGAGAALLTALLPGEAAGTHCRLSAAPAAVTLTAWLRSGRLAQSAGRRGRDDVGEERVGAEGEGGVAIVEGELLEKAAGASGAGRGKVPSSSVKPLISARAKPRA